MKLFLSIIYWLVPAIAFSQATDTLTLQRSNKPAAPASAPVHNNKNPYKPEIFTSGFIDIINNGQVNASARFIRLFIGEPGNQATGKKGFAIPLSLYSGVSANNFQNQTNSAGLLRSNEQLVNQYINPLSGLVNLSIDGVVFFKKTAKVTKSGWLYHVGERVMTGFKTGQAGNPQSGRSVNFLNSFFSSGLYFQTGAWERSNAKNVGVCWLAFRYHGCYTNPDQLKEFLPTIKTNGVYLGYSIGFGVEVNNLVNLKMIYYKYSKRPEIEYALPIYQFSFNYSMKN